MHEQKPDEVIVELFDPCGDVLIIGLVLGIPSMLALAFTMAFIPEGWPQYLAFLAILIGVATGAHNMAVDDWRRFGFDEPELAE